MFENNCSLDQSLGICNTNFVNGEEASINGKSCQIYTKWNIDKHFCYIQKKYSIPKKFVNWSSRDVSLWLNWCTKYLKIGGINRFINNIDGKMLMSFSQNDVKKLVPIDPDDVFFMHLELLRKTGVVATPLSIKRSIAPILNHSNKDERIIPDLTTPSENRDKITGLENLDGLEDFCEERDNFRNRCVLLQDLGENEVENFSQNTLSRNCKNLMSANKDCLGHGMVSDTICIAKTLVNNFTKVNNWEKSPLEVVVNSSGCGATSKDTPSQYNVEPIPQVASVESRKSSTAPHAVQLWQFLLDLLTDPKHVSIICWCGNEGAFKLMKPDRVATLWGLAKGNTSMNYQKLSRALRYYYDLKDTILMKVTGQKFTYKFCFDFESIIGYSVEQLRQQIDTAK